MNSVMSVIKSDLSEIRAGKADPAILKSIRVDCAGEVFPLFNLANVSAFDYKTLIVTPFLKDNLQSIEKAILKSNLGLNPLLDGERIRLNFPPLTKERRGELVSIIKDKIEKCKIKIRMLRQKAKDSHEIKSLSEDLKRDSENKIQKLTDNFVKKLDELYLNKEKSLMSL